MPLTMLLGYFMRTKKRATIVREVFREYMESCRENTKLAEQRALGASPDHIAILLNCFRLQHLLRERLTIRFEYLLTTKSLSCAPFNSLDDIQKRLDQGWTEAEEVAIKEGNSHYCDISREIELFNSNGYPTRSPLLCGNSCEMTYIARTRSLTLTGFASSKGELRSEQPRRPRLRSLASDR